MWLPPRGCSLLPTLALAGAVEVKLMDWRGFVQAVVFVPKRFCGSEWGISLKSGEL